MLLGSRSCLARFSGAVSRSEDWMKVDARKAAPRSRSRPRRRLSELPPAPPPADLPVVPRLFVSSSHLVSPRSQQLSEFEFGLIIASNAFLRWVVRCMAAAGLKDLTPLEVLLLHHVNHRARQKKLADICFMINIEDTHVVSYALKKLVSLGLVSSERHGKEVLFSTTAEGHEYIDRYRQVREGCLVAALPREDSENERLGEMAAFLRFLSGMYDQAARAASSL